MIAYGATGEKINQLEHVIQTYLGDNHRRSALQITIFDPHSDHTNQKQRGFPCLQSVSIAPLGAGELAITGYYPVQYIFAKAYGNYLGLCRLGNFIAHELQMEAVRMTCIAAIAVRGQNKSSLVSLQDVVHEAVRTSESV
jgi:thymidylate synthase